MMFFVILGLVAWIVFAFWPAFIAKRKGYNFWLFLLLGVLVSFVLALIVAVLLKDKTETARDKADNQAVEKAIREEETKK